MCRFPDSSVFIGGLTLAVAMFATGAYGAVVVHVSKKDPRRVVVEFQGSDAISLEDRVCLFNPDGGVVSCGRVKKLQKEKYATVRLKRKVTKRAKGLKVAPKPKGSTPRPRRRLEEPTSRPVEEPPTSEEDPWEAELFGHVGLEGRYFPHDRPVPPVPGPRPAAPAQENDDSSRHGFGSAYAQPGYRFESEDESVLFSAVGYVRYDQHETERTHGDIRELEGILVGESAELRLGIRRVFWGVAESRNVVDVVNQIDFVDDMSGDEKLGQPMVNFAWIDSWGTIDFFLLPYFRERTYPGENGRFRTPIPIDEENATYEALEEEKHLDWAARYRHYFAGVDLALSWFSGTSREPELRGELGPEVQPRLIPHYYLVNQTGLELQYATGNWLGKLEAIHRIEPGESHQETVAGFEYTAGDFLGTSSDLGVILEHLYDSRGEEATLPFENDGFAALRLSLNDIESTSALAGAFYDPDSEAILYSVEAERRIFGLFKLVLLARGFSGVPEDDPYYPFRKDSFGQLGIEYHF